MILLCVAAAYLVCDLLLRKILNVKNKGFIGKDERHNKIYPIIEKWAVILFLLVVLSDLFFHFLSIPYFLVWILFAFIWSLRGIEEWKYNRDEKEYIFNWLTSGTFFIIFMLEVVGVNVAKF
ncbi:DUF4181 domain-containing protein [Bacillus sp. RG28]|uniref:DUF4181 domain-containing protein n=1 Tax=Gottfriedia endophytica TaxID=2820819 RepID=A0A940NR01_9BACI|nr:DUF4181 domain-containing protein [Gottfriedia endophytica]MBP0725276.1 DUF4181 domain-containing protein [Gottfriedia endophytica]